jgi:hypothetical protein
MLTMEMRTDVLTEPMNGLDWALQVEFPGHEREWAQEVGIALTNVQQAMRLHAAAAEAPDGLFAKVDLTRPTLVRQVGKLRREHGELLERARSLEGELRTAAQAFQPSTLSLARANPLPEPPRATAIPDFGSIRQGAEQLLTGLQIHLQEEAKLLLDSVNIDIGVGD